MTQPQSAMRSSSGPSGARKSVVWNKELVISEVEAHPDLLTVPTFILFVQKDELAMSRAEVRKLERQDAQKEFEDWLYQQTQPRAPSAKKQGMNEESVAPVDDKERSAVAVRKPPAPGMPGKQGAGQRISRPSSDGFRVGQRPLGPPPQARAWNSQRGVRQPQVDAASPPRSRAMTMADTIVSDPVNPAAPGPPNTTQSRSPSRKTPTPRGTPRNGTPPPRSNGRPKTPTPRGKSPTPRPRAQTPTRPPSGGSTPGRPPQTPPKRPPSARKPASNRSSHSKASHA